MREGSRDDGEEGAAPTTTVLSSQPPTCLNLIRISVECTGNVLVCEGKN